MGKTWRFAGRSDQLVKVFGRWVDTVSLEQAIGQRLAGQVEESCIVPVGGGEGSMISLHLFAVPGARDPAEAGRIIDEALAGLPAYLRPEAVHLLADLPRPETGKLRRAELSKLAR